VKRTRTRASRKCSSSGIPVPLGEKLRAKNPSIAVTSADSAPDFSRKRCTEIASRLARSAARALGGENASDAGNDPRKPHGFPPPLLVFRDPAGAKVQ
jgi:hypothetical protein